MTDKNIQKLADEIASAINHCYLCPLQYTECDKSDMGTCDGVWYEHICKMEEHKNE